MAHGYHPGAFASLCLLTFGQLSCDYSIVDVHSHVGVESAPALDGAADGNSLKGTIQAWLRSIDGLNTHDESYALAVAGGVRIHCDICSDAFLIILKVTTSLILPGSANAIGALSCVRKATIAHRRVSCRRTSIHDQTAAHI